MSKNIASNSIPSKIFDVLLSEADDLLFLFYHPHAVLRTVGNVESARNMLARKERNLQRIKKSEINQSIRRLKTQKLLRINKKGNEIYFFLTESGIKEGLKRSIHKKKQRLIGKRRCYISFDIPEQASSTRWALRKLLKDSHFKMIHLSLWSSEFDVGKEMAVLIKIMKAETWVHVFEARALTSINKKTKTRNHT
jgi:DNA-binding transcriptional regulator PaaX